MRSFLALLGALAMIGCGADEDDAVTVEGVDPVNTDGDLAPDPTLRTDLPGLAPDADVAPEAEQAPDQTLRPDSLRPPPDADS